MTQLQLVCSIIKYCILSIFNFTWARAWNYALLPMLDLFWHSWANFQKNRGEWEESTKLRFVLARLEIWIWRFFELLFSFSMKSSNKSAATKTFNNLSQIFTKSWLPLRFSEISTNECVCVGACACVRVGVHAGVCVGRKVRERKTIRCVREWKSEIDHFHFFRLGFFST